MEKSAQASATACFDVEKQHVSLKHIYSFNGSATELASANVLDLESVASQIKAHLLAKPLGGLGLFVFEVSSFKFQSPPSRFQAATGLSVVFAQAPAGD